MSQERNEKEIGSAGSRTGENQPVLEILTDDDCPCLKPSHKDLEARCVRAEAERELALEAMREWKGRALILARQVKDMGEAGVTGPGNRETRLSEETVEELAAGYLRERAARVQAEEALREIRWLHHDESKTYQQLFFEATRIADRVLAVVPEKDKPCGECEGCIDGFDCCADTRSES